MIDNNFARYNATCFFSVAPLFDVVSCVSFIGPRLPLGYGLVMHQVAERTLGNTKLRPHLGAHMGKLKSNAPI